MKPLFLSFVTLFMVLSVSANDKGTDTTKHYLFPEFQKGIIYLKEGAAISNMMNYNLLMQELQFYNDKGKKQGVFNFNDIEYVSMGAGFDLIPLENDFAEIVKETDEVTLAVRHYTKISGASGSRKKIDKMLDAGETVPENVVFERDSVYYLVRMKKPEGISKGVFKGLALSKNRVEPATLIGFTKIYSGHRQEIIDFISSSDIDFNKQDDLIKLLDFCRRLDL